MACASTLPSRASGPRCTTRWHCTCSPASLDGAIAQAPSRTRKRPPGSLGVADFAELTEEQQGFVVGQIARIIADSKYGSRRCHRSRSLGHQPRARLCPQQGRAADPGVRTPRRRAASGPAPWRRRCAWARTCATLLSADDVDAVVLATRPRTTPSTRAWLCTRQACLGGESRSRSTQPTRIGWWPWLMPGT